MIQLSALPQVQTSKNDDRREPFTDQYRSGCRHSWCASKPGLAVQSQSSLKDDVRLLTATSRPQHRRPPVGPYIHSIRRVARQDQNLITRPVKPRPDPVRPAPASSRSKISRCPHPQRQCKCRDHRSRNVHIGGRSGRVLTPLSSFTSCAAALRSQDSSRWRRIRRQSSAARPPPASEQFRPSRAVLLPSPVDLEGQVLLDHAGFLISHHDAGLRVHHGHRQITRHRRVDLTHPGILLAVPCAVQPHRPGRCRCSDPKAGSASGPDRSPQDGRATASRRGERTSSDHSGSCSYLGAARGQTNRCHRATRTRKDEGRRAASPPC